MTESTARFGDYTPEDEVDRAYGGQQWLFRFPNGYGASVIRGPYTYGGDRGLFELGVTEYDGGDWELTYDTPITNDVIGHLTEDNVTEYLRRIEELAPATPGVSA